MRGGGMAAMPESCAMGARRGASAHSRTPLVCSCSVSSDQTAVMTPQPDLRFELPRSFSGPTFALSVEARTPPVSSPLAGYGGLPDKPPQA